MQTSRTTKILIGGAVAILGVVVVGAMLLMRFDWNRAKPWFNARVSEAMGRSFVIHGDLSW